MRNPALILIATAAAMWSHAARASGDLECPAMWQLQQPVWSDCSNLAYINPNNDTRVNLLLLLSDTDAAALRPGAGAAPPPGQPMFTWSALAAILKPGAPAADADQSAEYASGEGSRCRSNTAGTAAFASAVTSASGLSDAERAALLAARTALAPTCADGAPATPPPAGLASPMAQAFGTYLAGAADFYRGDYDPARAAFATLAINEQPWLKETAAYMLGRVGVNQAQAAAFDEFGRLVPAKVDHKALDQAEQGFDAYLHTYPDGHYAASAQGLLRRVYWLGNDTDKLAARFVATFANRAAITDLPHLLDEVDDKLLGHVDPNTVSDPLLLATLDLMAMRKVVDPANGTPLKTFSDADLTAQRPKFAQAPALFDYLTAVQRLFVAQNPDGALLLLPPVPPAAPFGALAYSKAVLRGLALEAKRDHRGARELWQAALPLSHAPFQSSALQLGLAQNYENDHMLAAVFAPPSPIQAQPLRDILLRNDAGPDLLTARIAAADTSPAERHQAKFVLLDKDVTRGRYQDFPHDHDLALPPEAGDSADNDDKLAAFDWAGGSGADQFSCPSLRATMAQLAQTPRRPAALLCLGEFIRLNGFDNDKLGQKPASPELGSAPSEFPGPLFSLLDAYRLVIADSRATASEKAYALYRAVNCYAPHGDNDCGGAGVALPVRKAWFVRLKHDFPRSNWAQQLTYYW